MKYLISLTLSIFFIQFNIAQNSQQSQKLLDEVSKIISSYNNVGLDFDYLLDNNSENMHQKATGNINVKGNQYHVNFMGIDRICDGKKVYSIVHEDEEVYISNINENNDSFTPSTILNFYKKGYRYTWGKLATEEGKKIQYIKLTPIKIDDIDYIMLGIDTHTKHISSISYIDKKNTKVTFKVRSFKPNLDLSSKEFSFDISKYKTKNYTITEL